MNLRDEAILREFKLYPLWVRKGMPAPVVEMVAEPVAVAETLASIESPAAVAVPAVAGMSAPVAEPVEPPSLETNWPALREAVRDCTACDLRAGCTQTVLGVGPEQADWLFVGEGPGAEEDARGEPFVGQAGKLLDNMLLAIGLKRGANLYIANVVKCRPPENRVPTPAEVATCLPYLQQQIALLRPKLIVALGKTAAMALLEQDVPLGSLRGRVHEYHLPDAPPEAAIPLIVTYHPAYLLRSPNEKAKAWQDLCLARERMQR